MIETVYLHLEFKNISGQWSINLPFLCTKCGICCTLEDFLTAGEILGKPEEHPQIYARNQAIFEEIGKIFDEDEAKYDNYIANNPCPFLVNNVCSIYEIRPGGCRLFPKTAFGMQTTDCPALIRFKNQRNILQKGKTCKETYLITSASSKLIKSTTFTEKQYNGCLAKLRRAGMTNDELALFNYFNQKKN
jgi:Fe-S-cluster containining protein